MAETRHTTIRLRETDIALLDGLQRELGLSSRSEVIRFVLHQHAKQIGLALPKPPPRKR